ncbi:MAG: futalosine hydrolase [Ferruginibacter sp.]
MQILLVAATELEITPFLKKRPAAEFLITGVGCPATIYHLTKRLQQIDYDLVIQAGIAGSFIPSLNLGDVVLVSQDNFADVGILEKGEFQTIFETGFANENSFPFTGGWLRNDNAILDNLNFKKVKAVTVNTVTDSELLLRQHVSKFDPQVETMEGAAMHYVCLNEGVAFMQLRSISNYVGERNKEKWKIKEAVDNLNTALLKMIDTLTANSAPFKPANK